jgi:putative chitinase
MTLEQFQQITTAKPDRVNLFYPYLSKYMQLFGISGRLREAAFLGQVLWESGQLRYTKEIASGNEYDTRTDLGNTSQIDGDGAKYKGRGLIQITGTSNYKEISTIFGEDFINHPELLETPRFACKSAAWWFNHHGLNELADQQNFNRITKIVNGGYNGLAGRTLIYEKALNILI